MKVSVVYIFPKFSGGFPWLQNFQKFCVSSLKYCWVIKTFYSFLIQKLTSSEINVLEDVHESVIKLVLNSVTFAIMLSNLFVQLGSSLPSKKSNSGCTEYYFQRIKHAKQNPWFCGYIHVTYSNAFFQLQMLVAKVLQGPQQLKKQQEFWQRKGVLQESKENAKS